MSVDQISVQEALLRWCFTQRLHVNNRKVAAHVSPLSRAEDTHMLIILDRLPGFACFKNALLILLVRAHCDSLLRCKIKPFASDKTHIVDRCC